MGLLDESMTPDVALRSFLAMNLTASKENPYAGLHRNMENTLRTGAYNKVTWK